jgi:hypothetical protein
MCRSVFSANRTFNRTNWTKGVVSRQIDVPEGAFFVKLASTKSKTFFLGLLVA